MSSTLGGVDIDNVFSDLNCTEVKSQDENKNAYRATVKLANENVGRVVNVYEGDTSLVYKCEKGDLHLALKIKRVTADNVTSSLNQNERDAHDVYIGMTYSIRGVKNLTMKIGLEALDVTDLP